MTTEKTSLQRKRMHQGIVLALVLSLVGVMIGGHLQSDVAEAPAELWLAVSEAPLKVRIGLLGKIEPQQVITLAAPFEGDIKRYLVEPGARVEAGQVLVEMDPTLIETQLRDALAAKLKAQRAAAELRNWSSGSQMMRARRAVSAAQMALGNAQRKLTESRTLFERGIVSRSEVDDLEQQVQALDIGLAAAREDREQVMEQGEGEFLQIAEMELSNATVKYDAVRKLLDEQNIRAPFAGVIVPIGVDSDSTGAGASVHTGSKVGKGQPMFGLANLEQLKIASRVSELDVNQLQPGQAVDIEGDGFGQRLSGVVDVVSRIALPDDDPGSAAQFPISLSISPIATDRQHEIRLGMSARLHIVTYSNDRAIVVAPGAIQEEAGAFFVEYREGDNQLSQRVAVTVGRSVAHGVEVFGLKSGFVRVAG